MQPRALIFDFFGVVCADIATPWIRRRLPQADFEAIHANYLRQLDAGKDPAPILEELGRLTGTTAIQVRSDWDGLAIVNTELVAAIRHWKGQMKIGLCTNTWGSFIDPILDHNDLRSAFDTIVISAEVGLLKPDPRIYEYTLSRLGVTPQEAVFADDNPHNVESAQQIGMTAFVFHGNEDFFEKMKGLGVA